MQIYRDWKWTKGSSVGEGSYVVNIDQGDTSWYDLMDELDKMEGRWVVCVAPEGNIAWYTNEHVAGRYAPSDGHTVVVTDSVPFEGHGLAVRDYEWNGSAFVEKEKESESGRTKEDIMADLIKLQEELKAL